MDNLASSSDWKSHVFTFHSGGRCMTPGLPAEPEDARLDSQFAQCPTRDPSVSSKSHSRKRPADHIPRPPNAFILFRSDFVQNNRIPASIEKNHQNISRIAGKVWSSMSDLDKREWYARAEREKERHAQKYPDYQYSPTDPVTLGRRRRVKKGRSENEVRAQSQRCEKVANLVVEGRSGQDLEHAVRQPDIMGPSFPSSQSTTMRNQQRPSSSSSLDDEDQPLGFTKTLAISSTTSGHTSSLYSLTKDRAGAPPPSSRPFSLSTPAFSKNPPVTYQTAPMARTFSNVLPSKVRSYGAPPTAFSEIIRPTRDTSVSWSLRDTTGSSDNDDDDDDNHMDSD